MSENIDEPVGQEPSHESLNQQVAIRCYFGSHDTAHDARLIEDHIGDVDVLMPEFHGVQVATRELWSGIGKGDAKAYRRLLSLPQSPFTKELANVVMRRSRLGRLDVFIPDDESVAKAIEIHRLLRKTPILSTVDATLENFCTACKRIGTIQSERDLIITNNIARYIDSRIESGDIPASRPLEIMVSYGKFHASIAESLAARGYSVETNIDPGSGLDKRDELIQCYQDGQLPSYELVQRAFVGVTIDARIQGEDSNAITLVKRIVSERVPYDMLETFCQQIVQAQTTDKMGEVEGDLLEAVTGFRNLGPAEIEQILSLHNQ